VAIECLDVPDEYERGEEALVEVSRGAIEERIAAWGGRGSG
jgi:hypothetical protein